MSPATYALGVLFVLAALAATLLARQLVDTRTALREEHDEHDWTRICYQTAASEAEHQRRRAALERARADSNVALFSHHRAEVRTVTDSLCDAIATIASMRDLALPDLRDPLSLLVTDPAGDTPLFDAMPVRLLAEYVAVAG